MDQPEDITNSDVVAQLIAPSGSAIELAKCQVPACTEAEEHSLVRTRGLNIILYSAIVSPLFQYERHF